MIIQDGKKYYILKTRDGIESEMQLLHDYRPYIELPLKPKLSGMLATEALPDQLEDISRKYKLRRVIHCEIYMYEEK